MSKLEILLVICIILLFYNMKKIYNSFNYTSGIESGMIAEILVNTIVICILLFFIIMLTFIHQLGNKQKFGIMEIALIISVILFIYYKIKYSIIQRKIKEKKEYDENTSNDILLQSRLQLQMLELVLFLLKYFIFILSVMILIRQIRIRSNQS